MTVKQWFEGIVWAVIIVATLIDRRHRRQCVFCGRQRASDD